MCPAAPGSDVGAGEDLGTWFGAAALGTSGKCSFIWADTSPGRRSRDPGDNPIPLMHSEENSVCLPLWLPPAIRTNSDGLV